MISDSDDWSHTDLSDDDDDDFERRLYSVAFAWRSDPKRPELGRPWNSDDRHRKSVKWYADCLMDTIYQRARREPTCRFIIHLHAALPNLQDIKKTAISTFREARRNVPDQDTGGIRFSVCPKEYPAMWPQAARMAPLIDDVSDFCVVVIDIHDDDDQRNRRIGEILTCPKDLIVTFWKARGDLASSFRNSNNVAPPVTLRVRRDSNMVNDDVHWSLDAGLAISRAPFRHAVAETLHIRRPYTWFLNNRGQEYEYDETSGTDESLLKLFLLSHSPLVDLVKTMGQPFTHSLTLRKTAPPSRATRYIDTVPHYKLRKAINTFAYDEEVEGTLRFRPLEWDTPISRKRAVRLRLAS